MSEQQTTAPVEKSVRIFRKGNALGHIHCRGFVIESGHFYEVPESVAKILFEHREGGGGSSIVDASNLSKVDAQKQAETDRLSAETATLLERIAGLERLIAEQQAKVDPPAGAQLPEPIERVRRGKH